MVLDNSSPPVHFALTCYWFAGHLGPMVQLAHCLVTPKPWKPRTYVTLAVQVHPDIEKKVTLPQEGEYMRVLTMRNVMTSTEWVSELDSHNENGADYFTPLLTARHSDWPQLTAVISDFVSGYGVIMAERLKVPCITFLASPLFILWTLCYQKEIQEGGKNGEFVLPGIGAFSTEYRKSANQDNISEQVRVCQIIIETSQKTQGCLANDIQCLYSPEFWASVPFPPLHQSWKVFCCGPLVVHTPLTGLSTEVKSFLEKWPKRSVLYIALGSIWYPKPHELRELLHGVALTNRPFLFSYRKPYEYLYMDECDNPNEYQDDGLPVGFRESVADRGLILPWLGQPAVLKHKSIGAFMTHCGWNSTVEGLSLGGVPLLLLPLGADQYAISDLLERHLKCGKRVWGPQFTLEREQVRHQIDSIFTENEIATRSQQLQALVSIESIKQSDINLMNMYNHIDKLSVIDNS
eukprot:Protomagalhaensia_wolfi_Nauph_80__1992@NODE_225_length_3130_cov_1194_052087_g167_i0_p2_GENE_NODE_225_length_3130_cov_1194_052087_g167_i0NODE_225_length_3130_cov_1194_052087_g167_i0_p2_ORF_typecomplete_len463_score66_54UDPGT/PF00201_18/1e35Glyco_tran_28_C/PF04101_16/0_18_NODE_225_length_3130_cov_1194_052087_g167_i016923080